MIDSHEIYLAISNEANEYSQKQLIDNKALFVVTLGSRNSIYIE